MSEPVLCHLHDHKMNILHVLESNHRNYYFDIKKRKKSERSSFYATHQQETESRLTLNPCQIIILTYSQPINGSQLNRFALLDLALQEHIR